MCVCVCVYVCVCMCVSIYVQFLSRVKLFEIPWTVAHQAPLSMEFSREGYWSGLPFSIPGDPPDPGIETVSLASPALADGFFTTVLPGKPNIYINIVLSNNFVIRDHLNQYIFMSTWPFMWHIFILFYCISIYFISLYENMCRFHCAMHHSICFINISLVIFIVILRSRYYYYSQNINETG